MLTHRGQNQQAHTLYNHEGDEQDGQDMLQLLRALKQIDDERHGCRQYVAGRTSQGRLDSKPLRTHEVKTEEHDRQRCKGEKDELAEVVDPLQPCAVKISV